MTANRCQLHDEPLTRCPDSLELVCGECSQEHARRQTELAIDEYYRDVDMLPKFDEPSQFVEEQPQ